MESLFKKYQKTGQELEVRFGTFSKTFLPEISKEQFNRIFTFLSNNKKFYTYSSHEQKIEYFGDIRKITEGKKEWFNKKTKSKQDTFDDKEWSFRVSLSHEEEVNPVSINTPDLIKYRQRHSFVNEKAKTKFDLDIYYSETSNNYTVELECLEGCSFKQLNNDIHLILQILQESKKPLSKSETNQILKYYQNTTKSRKFIGVQPETLSIEKYKKKENYAITKKLDGRRYLLMFYEGNLYSISSKMEIKWANYSYEDSNLNGLILDTEYFKGFYHIFDVINPDVGNLYSRILFIQNLIQKITPLEDSKKLVLKHIIFTSNTSELYKAFIKETKTLDSKLFDGVILIRQDTSYKNSNPLKWKPIHMNTIDFLIKKTDANVLDLYVTSKNDLELFASTEVTKEQYKMYDDDSIVEFAYIDSKWVPIKSRFDKEKPNYIAIAKDNLNSILCPFNPEQVFDQNVALYNLRRFHNYIKRIYIEKYKGNSVLDLAIGKGGDLGKYNSSGFNYIEGYDIDATSIKEATCRASVMMNKSNSNINVKLFVKDLTKEEVLSKVTFDLVVSNFAFHYFYNTIDIYIKSVKNNLKKGGYLILTFFDGDKIENIKTTNYEIKKINKKQISVWMRDSVLNKPEVEYIVDTKKVIEKFTNLNFELVENVDFEEYYPKWSKNNHLSDEEKKLSFMNKCLVFKLK